MLLVAHRTPPSAPACAELAAAGAQIFEVDVQIDDRDRIVASHYFPMGPFGLFQRDNWHIRWHTRAQRDPQLAEFVDHVPADCRLLLDLKEHAPARRDRLRAALMAPSLPRERMIACGPHDADLEAYRQAGFATWRTAGTPVELAEVLAARRLPDDAVTVRHTLLTVDVLRRLHDRVPVVVAWTVNDPARANRLRELGVDGVTTDRVTVLRALSPS